MSKTPAFLQKIQWIFGIIGAMALGTMLANTQLKTGFEDEKWFAAIKIIAVVSAGIVAGIQFATDNPYLAQKK